MSARAASAAAYVAPADRTEGRWRHRPWRRDCEEGSGCARPRHRPCRARERARAAIRNDAGTGSATCRAVSCHRARHASVLLPRALRAKLPLPVCVAEDGTLHAPARSVVAQGQPELAKPARAATVEEFGQSVLHARRHRRSLPGEAQLAKVGVGRERAKKHEQPLLPQVVALEVEHLEGVVTANGRGERGCHVVLQPKPREINVGDTRVAAQQCDRCGLTRNRPADEFSVVVKVERAEARVVVSNCGKQCHM